MTASAQPEPALDAGSADAWVGQRFTAFLLDMVWLQTSQILGGIVALTHPALVDAYLPAFGAVVLIGYQAYLVATTGQSLGKRFCRIRIVNRRGGPPGFARAVLLRSWAFTVTFAIVALVAEEAFDRDVGVTFWFLVLLAAAPIFGRTRRCVHDFAAGTRVVQVKMR